MFHNCTSLTHLDVSSFDTSNVTEMERMFGDCSVLTTIYVSDKWNTNAATSSYAMFINCTSLVGGNGTTFNASYIDKTYARVDTASTPGYFTKKTV